MIAIISVAGNRNIQEQKKNCNTISDKARCIAGSVVEVLMANGVLP